MLSLKEKKREYWNQWRKNNPEKVKKIQKRYYETHRKEQYERHKEYAKKYREIHKESNREYRKQYWEQHKEIENKKGKEKRLEIKNKIIELLGGKCSNPSCLVPNGCLDKRCLQIDHIHGKGIKHRQEIGSRYQEMILEEIKNNSKDYQLLCANCNWIKRFENNEF